MSDWVNNPFSFVTISMRKPWYLDAESLPNPRACPIQTPKRLVKCLELEFAVSNYDAISVTRAYQLQRCPIQSSREVAHSSLLVRPLL